MLFRNWKFRRKEQEWGWAGGKERGRRKKRRNRKGEGEKWTTPGWSVAAFHELLLLLVSSEGKDPQAPKRTEEMYPTSTALLSLKPPVWSSFLSLCSASSSISSLLFLPLSKPLHQNLNLKFILTMPCSMCTSIRIRVFKMESKVRKGKLQTASGEEALFWTPLKSQTLPFRKLPNLFF